MALLGRFGCLSGTWFPTVVRHRLSARLSVPVKHLPRYVLSLAAMRPG